MYPTDVSDEEWEFVVSYLTVLREDFPQRVYALHEVFDAVYWRSQSRLSVADAARQFLALASRRAASQTLDAGGLL